MPDWETFSSTVKRLTDEFDFREIRVFAAQESYDPNTGNYTQEYTEHAQSPIKAEVREPNQPSITRDADGAETKVDATVFVDNDTGIDWSGIDENPDWPDKIEDTLTGAEYRIYELFDEDNGLIKLYGVGISSGVVDPVEDTTAFETTFESAFIG